MTVARAAWKGFLKVGPVSCAVKVVGATTEAGKVHFRILNRKTRRPVSSAYVDEDTGRTVPAEDQVKGYQTDAGDFVEIEQEEIKALRPTSEHTLDIEGFVAADAVDQRYLEKPYYLLPADRASEKTFAVLREAMREKKAVARSCIVLYQRGREVLIRPEGAGMVMTTLRTANEVVAAAQASQEEPQPRARGGGKAKRKSKPGVDPDMVEIAELLIDKKKTTFDPSTFEDRYEDALIAMIEAKKAGRKPPKPAPQPRKTNVVDLADVLRKSLAQESGPAPRKRGGKAA